MDVQKEHGFTPIANTYLDRLCAEKLPDTARRVLFAIMRHTWGWSRKESVIKYIDIAQCTRKSRQEVRRAVGWLVEHNMITVSGSNGSATFCIQKDPDKWVGLHSPVDSTVQSDGTPQSTPHIKQNINKLQTTSVREGTLESNVQTVAEGQGEPQGLMKDETQKVLNRFRDAYREYYGVPYVVQWGKDQVIIQRLLTSIGYQEVCVLIGALFLSTDPFFDTAGRTIGTMSACANKLRKECLLRQVGNPSVRQLRNRRVVSGVKLK